MCAQQLFDFVTDDNLAKQRYGKNLKQLISIYQTTPLPGVSDFYVGLILFRTSVHHEGLPTALGNLAFDGMPDLHQVLSIAMSASLQAGAWSLVELYSVHEDVEAWWAETIAAFELADHSKNICKTEGLTAKINGMQQTYDLLVDDDRYFLDTNGQPMPGRKAEYVGKLQYSIGLLTDMRARYEFYGDVDGDGDVDTDDAAEVDEHFGQTVPVGTNGDVDHDGDVDFSDFLIVSDRQGMSIY